MSDKIKSTIMFTDIVGYSAMVNKNQDHTMELLSTHDSIIEPIISENNGKVIKKIGDAIFAEFPEPIDSVKTSIDIQSELKSRNKKVIIKGCGEIPLSEALYVAITKKLQITVSSLMFGEACSAVPVFKKK